jgi:hypothetical protein
VHHHKLHRLLFVVQLYPKRKKKLNGINYLMIFTLICSPSFKKASILSVGCRIRSRTSTACGNNCSLYDLENNKSILIIFFYYFFSYIPSLQTAAQNSSRSAKFK